MPRARARAAPVLPTSDWIARRAWPAPVGGVTGKVVATRAVARTLVCVRWASLAVAAVVVSTCQALAWRVVTRAGNFHHDSPCTITIRIINNRFSRSPHRYALHAMQPSRDSSCDDGSAICAATTVAAATVATTTANRGNSSRHRCVRLADAE
mmetsp:Transcript_3690/g.13576  ORF Transcript_3690/g.13576 Transcript_3690/m.13576 type:complete len:153 (-) Transcript_3690:19-477(-)